eukprot:TRINITY_DN139058_c0_g1_i1.p1 TRINITY_DN139058_c0_g1~~TRINITY_DN139058_c0_g1_i1.p1  ORF type:complete len:242 (-),score=0.38 TRINITY_DN139058_c0_g1_i1:72-749(-)
MTRLKGYIRTFIYNLLRVFFLLYPARTLDWPAGWLYLLICFVVEVREHLKLDSALKEERDSMGSKEGSQDWDKSLAKFRILLQLLTLSVCGFDQHYQWSSTTAIVQGQKLLGVFLILEGHAIRIWAQSHNLFFSSIVRIQKDRGHKVCTTGPYQFIRHPGYFGSFLIHLGIPLLLSSVFAYATIGISTLLQVVRIIYEEKLLVKELDGYKAYVQKVKYRFIPLIW